MTPTAPRLPVVTRLAPRQRFISELRNACERRTGYAAGKLGESERSWLAYPIVRKREDNAKTRRAFELVLGYRSVKAAGVFPPRAEFFERWTARFVEDVAALDSIGVTPRGDPFLLLAYHGIDLGRAIYFKDPAARSLRSEFARAVLPPCLRRPRPSVDLSVTPSPSPAGRTGRRSSECGRRLESGGSIPAPCRR